MKAKNVITLLLAAAAMAACTDYDNGYTEKELDHIQGFKEVFGEIDNTNDWNAAEQGSLTVTPAQAGQRIKVYANTFGTYTLVADYPSVSGTEQLNFDMLEGTDYLIVSDGAQAVAVSNGDNVALTAGAKTRTTLTAGADGLNAAGVSVAATYKDFSPAFLQKAFEVLPEEEYNLDKVSQNFSYVSTGQFTIYPLYWQTSSYHTLGIYWKDANGDYKTQDIYSPRQGDELAVKNADGTYTPVGAGLYGNASTANIDYNLGSKGITVNLPIGTQFGFYLDVFSDAALTHYEHSVYSQSEINRGTAKWTLSQKATTTQGWDGNNVSGTPVFAATFQATVDGQNAQYLCFEDWNLAGPDLNDLVFAFTGDNIPTILDDDATSWVLSAEDLGGTFDIDYNDVVLAVNHVAGQTTATVTPLAAGGTLASYIFFGDKTEANCLGEIHSFFGQGLTTSGSYIPVNVSSTTPAQQAGTITISVPANFSMATLVSQDRDQTSSVMGGFKVVTIPQGETPSVAAAITSTAAQTIQNTATQNDDNVPYVICTPQRWKRDNGDGTITIGNYRWPLETKPMFNFGSFSGAAYDYSDQYSFRAWIKGENKTQSRYWYVYPNLALTCANGTPNTISGNGTGAAGSDETQNTLRTSTLTAVYNPSVTTGVKQEIIIKSKVGVTPTYVGPKDGATANYNIENPYLVALDKEGDYYRWKFNLVLNTGGSVTIVYSQDATAVYEAGNLEVTVSAYQERSFSTSANITDPYTSLWQNSTATSQTVEVTAGQTVQIWWNNNAGDGTAFQQQTFNAGGTGSTLEAMQYNNGFTFTAGQTAGTATIVLSMPASGTYSETKVGITITVKAAGQQDGDEDNSQSTEEHQGSYLGNGVYDLSFSKGNKFVYLDKDGNSTTYTNATLIKFDGVEAVSGQEAILHIDFDAKDFGIYIDYKGGSQLKEDWVWENVAQGKDVKLDASAFAKAISEGGLYILKQYDTNASVNITKATLTITPASAKRR